MSLFPDITPLTNEVKKFNASQQEIISLLKEQNQLLKLLTKK